MQIVREQMPYGSVLIVDDVETNLYVARGLLLPYGLKIETAISGFETLDIIQSGAVFDIVFMDHMMPEMDGIKTVKKLRGMGYTAPIVALTANAITGNDVMFMENGFDGFISKPIDLRQLDEVLHKFVRKGHKKMTGPPVVADMPDVMTEPDFEIAGVDVSAGIRNVGGSVDNYKKALEFFCKDGKARVLEIAQSHLQNEIKLFITHVHAIKSACANIGALGLSEAAKALEAAGNGGDEQYIGQNVGDFLNDLKGIIQNISRFLTDSKPAGTGEKMNTDEVNRKLKELRTALEDIDIGAIDEIVSELGKISSLGIVDEITQGVLISDYDGVICAIDKYLEGVC